MYQRTRIILDWAVVLIEYSLILLIIPISDKLLLGLNQNSVNALLNLIINIIIGLVYISLLAYLIKRGKASTVGSYAWLAFFFIISVYFLMKVQITTDRFHFLGYGILTLFLYRALRHNIGTKMLYVWSAIFVMIFAILDESLQLIGLGGRAFELKDIGTDWLSSLIGQGIIALVVRPQLETIDIKIRSYTKALKKAKVFSALRAQEAGGINLDRLTGQVCLAFKKFTGRDSGHVHFMYEGKSDHLIFVCAAGKLENIIAKGRNCKKGEYLSWGHSEFNSLSAKEAFFKNLPKARKIVIDHPSLRKSWDSFNEFQNWLNTAI
ncbi:MAG: VanZ family protein [Candidatus Omnitrophota bacterium]